jgi:hypothetical protein
VILVCALSSGRFDGKLLPLITGGYPVTISLFGSIVSEHKKNGSELTKIKL